MVCNANLIRFASQTCLIFKTFNFMETNKLDSDSFDEIKSLQVIKEMIQVSRKEIKSDGILLILWGWLNFLQGINEFTLQSVVHTHTISQFASYLRLFFFLAGILFTMYYIYKKRQKVTTYIGVSLRYVWISLIFGCVLINLIQYNSMSQINFGLQHPIFMVLVAFAIVVTGSILRYKIIIVGGCIFGFLAYISSFFPLQIQLLIEAISWFIAFIIPGHYLYSQRKKI